MRGTKWLRTATDEHKELLAWQRTVVLLAFDKIHSFKSIFSCRRFCFGPANSSNLIAMYHNFFKALKSVIAVLQLQSCFALFIGI